MIGNLGVTEVLCGIAVIVAGIWYYFMGNYGYWKKLGVPGPEPKFFFGNWKEMATLTRSVTDILRDITTDFPDAPLVGFYSFRSPLLIVRDLELVRDVLIKDFSNFSERNTPLHEKVEPLNAHLFNLETKRWRALRPKLSPAFTSGKMKQMFSLMLECSEYFQKYIDKLVDEGELIDCREVAAKFTTDVIGSCAFGLQMNSISSEDSEFRKMGKKLFEPSSLERFLTLLRGLYPWIYDLIGIPVTPVEVSNFFTASIKETLHHRQINKIHRGDLIDILVDIKNAPQTPDLEFTDSLVTAQAFIFFVAGFETSATTISHALLELAVHQDVQDRLRKEILESLEKYDGKLSYESVKEMKYLHMVFQETLRLRPPVATHFRTTLNDYTFKDTNVTIRKGQMIWIPVVEIQTNPKYYPNPDVFDPERFTDEMCKARHPMTYIPFGDGPRNCIGARFAVYQTKLGLIKIISKYKVELSEKVQLPFKPNPKSFLLQPTGGIHLKFSKLNK